MKRLKDFYPRAMLFGAPPKILRLALSNCNRDDLLALIWRHKKGILRFAPEPESVLVLT
jgi:predicted nuclease of predicted toxin-antitoxin system